MLELVLPPIPTSVPVATATWQEWDIYLRIITIRNNAAVEVARAEQEAQRQATNAKWAQAQADTATAMQAAAAAQKAATEAFLAPNPRETDEQLWQRYLHCRAGSDYIRSFAEARLFADAALAEHRRKYPAEPPPSPA